MTRPVLPLVAAGLGMVGLMVLAVHVCADRLRSPLAEVRAVVRDVKESVVMVYTMVQLPHMVAAIESAARPDTTGFSWEATYTMIGNVRETAAAIRDTLNADALRQITAAATTHMSRILDVAQSSHQPQSQECRSVSGTGDWESGNATTPFVNNAVSIPLNPSSNGTASTNDNSAVRPLSRPHSRPDVAHQVMLITSNIRDMVATPAFSRLAEIASQPERFVHVLIQAAVVIFIFLCAVVVVVF